MNRLHLLILGRRRWRRGMWLLVTLVFISVTGCTALFRGPVLPPEPLPPTPILDMHCHVAGIGAGNSGCFVSPRLLQSWKLDFYLRSFGVSTRELRDRGDVLCGERLAQTLAASRSVGRAIVLAMDGVVDTDGRLDMNRSEFYVPNEFVAALAVQHTNLLFGASINPYRPDALARLDRAAADGERDVDRLARLMTQYPNLYADISSLTQINKLGALREVLRRPEFRERLVYGTDFPLINMPIVSPWFFPLDLKPSEMWRISRIKNPWDRDVAFKQALGVPADVFTRAETLLP